MLPQTNLCYWRSFVVGGHYYWESEKAQAISLNANKKMKRLFSFNGITLLTILSLSLISVQAQISGNNTNQPSENSSGDVNGKSVTREMALYGGSFSFHKDLKGESQKAPVVLFGVRYAWTTKNNPSHRLRYYMDFIPLIIVNYRERRLIQSTPTTTAIVGDRKTVFGVGFTPIGLQFNWRNSKKFQPFIAGGFGLALFNKKFPDNRSPLQPDKFGSRFQLMPEFGAGVEIRRSKTRSYFLGYKYHHLSNGYTAPLNVGYNTNMIYGGMYFEKGK